MPKTSIRELAEKANVETRRIKMPGDLYLWFVTREGVLLNSGNSMDREEVAAYLKERREFKEDSQGALND